MSARNDLDSATFKAKSVLSEAGRSEYDGSIIQELAQALLSVISACERMMRDLEELKTSR